MLYSILNRSSPVPTKTKLKILQLYQTYSVICQSDMGTSNIQIKLAQTISCPKYRSP